MDYTEEGSAEQVLNRYLSRGSRTQLQGERDKVLKAMQSFSKGHAAQLIKPKDEKLEKVELAVENLASHVEKHLRPDLAGSRGKEVLLFIKDLRELFKD